MIENFNELAAYLVSIETSTSGVAWLSVFFIGVVLGIFYGMLLVEAEHTRSDWNLVYVLAERVLLTLVLLSIGIAYNSALVVAVSIVPIILAILIVRMVVLTIQDKYLFWRWQREVLSWKELNKKKEGAEQD